VIDADCIRGFSWAAADIQYSHDPPSLARSACRRDSSTESPPRPLLACRIRMR
jgi:hypothetical protein